MSKKQNKKNKSKNQFSHLTKFIGIDPGKSGGITLISDEGIEMTELGRDFSQNISNVFDKYDPPTKSYSERLATIKNAKLAQAKLVSMT